MKARDIQLVVVTGAGSGIGRATALRFAKDKAKVICLDLDKATAADTVSLIEQAGGTGHAYRLDVTDTAAYGRTAARIKKAHGVPDVVVNNAGIVTVGGTLTTSYEDWKRVIDVNLTGVVTGCRLFGRQMAERGTGGHLVNIASLAAYTPTAAGGPYSTSKAAVRMLSESLRAELAAEKIGVSVICPGGIKTNIWRSADYVADGVHNADERNAMTYGLISLMERFGLGSPPEAVADAVARAVHHNFAIVPVRPEAWATFALSRLSPELLRLASRMTGERTVEALARTTNLPVIGTALRRLRHV